MTAKYLTKRDLDLGKKELHLHFFIYLAVTLRAELYLAASSQRSTLSLCAGLDYEVDILFFFFF